MKFLLFPLIAAITFPNQINANEFDKSHLEYKKIIEEGYQILVSFYLSYSNHSLNIYRK